MEFEWDENKNRWNIEKRGFGFDRAKTIFKRPMLTKEDKRKDYGETRYISVGQMDEGIIATVVHTERGERIRIISARVADRKERRDYNEYTRKNN